MDKGLTSFGGSADNTSAFDTAAGPLTFNYGVEALRDQASRSVNSSVIEQNPLYASGYASFNPPGQRDIASLFINGKWEPASWVTVSAGLRYDWYRLKGLRRITAGKAALEVTSVPCDARSDHYTAQQYYDQVFLPMQSIRCTGVLLPAGIYTSPVSGLVRWPTDACLAQAPRRPTRSRDIQNTRWTLTARAAPCCRTSPSS